MMKIGIIGGGSIGLLYAFYLNQQHEVTLYVRSDEQKDIISLEGIFLNTKENRRNERIHVEYIHNWKGQEEITFVAVKEYHLDPLLATLSIHTKTVFIFLQNGMGHLEKLERLKNQHVYIGTVEHGALKVNKNEVNHTGMGVTKLAPLMENAEPTLLSNVVANSEDFPFVLYHNYEEIMLKKLVANAVINPLTAILKIRNGLLIEDPSYFKVFKILLTEVTAALSIKESQEIETYVESICRKTAHNHSSMFKDIVEGRKTEVDSIVGYCLNQAKKSQESVPLLTSCYFMIKGMEKKGEND